MLRRRFRRRKTTDENSKSPRISPLAFTGLMFAVAVLLMVIAYDRRGVRDGDQNMTLASQMVTDGLYSEAAEEYEKAIGNSRLSRRKRAEAAIALANLYYERFEDYPQANSFFIQARNLHGPATESSAVQERMKLSKERSSGTALVGRRKVTDADSAVNTETIIQRVELISPPAEDEQGPVLATYRGGQIRAGELKRILRNRTEFYNPDFRREPMQLKTFVQEYVDDEVAYQAGLEAGLHLSPDVSERLYEYQKRLVTERFRTQAKEDRMTVTNDDVTSFYNANLSRYQTSGTVNLSVFKSDSEASATEALADLRAGGDWNEVVGRYTRDALTTGATVTSGTYTDGDRAVPGVGQHPALGLQLSAMAPGSVSGVTNVSGHIYIFKILNNTPGRYTSVDEARGRIEQEIRGAGVTSMDDNLHAQMVESFKPVLDQNGLDQFWAFALNRSEGRTTATASSAEASTGGVVGTIE